MSRSPVPWLRSLAGILACGPTLMAVGGCHHRSSAVNEPSAAERVIAPRDRQGNDHRGLPHFPGLDVSRTPGGGVTIRVLSAMVGDGHPLYVIDGAPVVSDPRRGISWLRPEDIARIRLLKEPVETSVYGPHGVNGVILVTTKQADAVRSRQP